MFISRVSLIEGPEGRITEYYDSVGHMLGELENFK